MNDADARELLKTWNSGAEVIQKADENGKNIVFVQSAVAITAIKHAFDAGRRKREYSAAQGI